MERGEQEPRNALRYICVNDLQDIHIGNRVGHGPPDWGGGSPSPRAAVAGGPLDRGSHKLTPLAGDRPIEHGRALADRGDRLAHGGGRGTGGRETVEPCGEVAALESGDAPEVPRGGLCGETADVAFVGAAGGGREGGKDAGRILEGVRRKRQKTGADFGGDYGGGVAHGLRPALWGCLPMIIGVIVAKRRPCVQNGRAGATDGCVGPLRRGATSPLLPLRSPLRISLALAVSGRRGGEVKMPQVIKYQETKVSPNKSAGEIMDLVAKYGGLECSA